MKLKTLAGLLIVLFLLPPPLISKEKTYTVRDVSNIEFDSPGTLYLTQGDTYALVINGNSDQLKDIIVRQRRDKLVIRQKRRLFGWGAVSLESMTIYLTLPDLSAISADSSGSVYSTSVFRELGNVVLEANSSGHIEFEGSAEKIEAKASSSGYILLRGEVDSLYLNASSISDIGFFGSVSGQLHALALSSGKIRCQLTPDTVVPLSQFNLSSSGDIVVTGMGDRVEASLSSSGNLNCNGFVCADLAANLSSSGSVSAIVSRTLKAKISSSGNVYYLGSPDIEASTSSSGQVLTMNK